ncbi:dihydroorotase [Burkholderiaceae bacterium DAT-1]|nr:dihydroorotase [Burkholderiaceae bacterium DAT-1]
MKRIAILNGRVIDPASGLDQVANVYLAKSHIAAVGTAPEGFVADDTIDAAGKWVIPGLVDLSARLGEPGGEQKKMLQSELGAAVAGGVTTVCALPDTDPALDEPSLVRTLRDRADAIGLARVLPVGALTRKLKGEELAELAELRDAGCVAFSQADAPISDLRVLLRAMQYAATFGLTLRLRPQDASLAAGGVAHDGEVATRLGLPGIPVMAETTAISNIVILMRDTGARVHLERVSSAEGLEMVRAARSYGLPLSCDVSIHHVQLSDVDIGFFDSNARMNPPLRSLRDRDAISEALLDGTVSAICSDHTPVGKDAKLLPFGEATPGASALEVLLTQVLAWGERQHIEPARALRTITSEPAALLGFKDRGTLSAGSIADVVIFDPAIEWRPGAATLKSRSKHTPFADTAQRGKVVTTIVGGKVAFRG